eukprot:2649067-Alexandrium_andersonii.AAC.1
MQSSPACFWQPNYALPFRKGIAAAAGFNRLLLAIRVCSVGISDRARHCGSARLVWGVRHC